MGYRRYGYAMRGRHCGHPGFFFFPPFALLFGFGLLFVLFHTGLWIPLLIMGLVFWGMRHRHDDWGQRKWGDWSVEAAPEKAKHDDYDYI